MLARRAGLDPTIPWYVGGYSMLARPLVQRGIVVEVLELHPPLAAADQLGHRVVDGDAKVIYKQP